jgi:hypothetical protein
MSPVRETNIDTKGPEHPEQRPSCEYLKLGSTLSPAKDCGRDLDQTPKGVKQNAKTGLGRFKADREDYCSASKKDTSPQEAH